MAYFLVFIFSAILNPDTFRNFVWDFALSKLYTNALISMLVDVVLVVLSEKQFPDQRLVSMLAQDGITSMGNPCQGTVFSSSMNLIPVL